MLKHREPRSVAVVVASNIPAAFALALAGTNHSETLRLDA
jgi:hypothetical protein